MTLRTILSASSLDNDDVKNTQGEDLGSIKDIMINTVDQRVEYYVLSFGGILGMGDKLFAIPPEALKLDQKNKCFILNIEKDQLKEADGFNKDNWPDMADPSFRQQVYNRYGYNEKMAA